MGIGVYLMRQRRAAAKRRWSIWSWLRPGARWWNQTGRCARSKWNWTQNDETAENALFAWVGSTYAMRYYKFSLVSCDSSTQNGTKAELCCCCWAAEYEARRERTGRPFSLPKRLAALPVGGRKRNFTTRASSYKRLKPAEFFTPQQRRCPPHRTLTTAAMRVYFKDFRLRLKRFWVFNWLSRDSWRA